MRAEPDYSSSLSGCSTNIPELVPGASSDRLTVPPHARQLHHGRLEGIGQAPEPRREEGWFGEDAYGVHVAIGVDFHVREVVAEGDCVGEVGVAVEVSGAEDWGGAGGDGEGEEGEEGEEKSGGEEHG